MIFDLDVAPSYFAQAKLGQRGRTYRRAATGGRVETVQSGGARNHRGDGKLQKMASKLLKLGPKIVALTMGADGCLIAEGNQMVRVPPFQVQVVDSTGAGDAFIGGLSFGLLQGWDHQRVGGACQRLRSDLLYQGWRAMHGATR